MYDLTQVYFLLVLPVLETFTASALFGQFGDIRILALGTLFVCCNSYAVPVTGRVKEWQPHLDWWCVTLGGALCFLIDVSFVDYLCWMCYFSLVSVPYTESLRFKLGLMPPIQTAELIRNELQVPCIKELK